MQRLVAFGCSHTFGHGLKDCITDDNGPGDKPSRYAWPAVLASQLNCRVINRGIPGASNLQILNAILNFKFRRSDIVVIMWADVNRDLIFKQDGEHRPIGSWGTDKDTKHWIMLHNDFDLLMRSWMCINHATLHLTSMNISNHSFFYRPEELKEVQPRWCSIKVNDIGVLAATQIDLALDNAHMGPIAHATIADRIKNLICL